MASDDRERAEKLVDAVKDVLTPLAQISGLSAGRATGTSLGAPKLYEVWLWAVVLDTASRFGFQVELRDTPSGQLVVRGAPGSIQTSGPTWAKISRDGRAAEVHLGVQVSGHTGVLHEADVLVIWHDEGEVCRRHATPRAPAPGSPLIWLEAKYSTVPEDGIWIGHARGLLGLTLEVRVAEWLAIVANKRAGRAHQLLGQRISYEVTPSTAKHLRTRLTWALHDMLLEL